MRQTIEIKSVPSQAQGGHPQAPSVPQRPQRLNIFDATAIPLSGSAISSSSKNPGAGAHWLPMQIVRHVARLHIAPTSSSKTCHLLPSSSVNKSKQLMLISPVLRQKSGARVGRTFDDGWHCILRTGQSYHVPALTYRSRYVTFFLPLILISLTSLKSDDVPVIPFQVYPSNDFFNASEGTVISDRLPLRTASEGGQSVGGTEDVLLVPVTPCAGGPTFHITAATN